jgi:hypothetical protein
MLNPGRIADFPLPVKTGMGLTSDASSKLLSPGNQPIVLELANGQTLTVSSEQVDWQSIYAPELAAFV